MAVQVYTFKITYLGVENRLWRTAQVSSYYDLARLGFMVLSTINTLACHLFRMNFNGLNYFLDIEEPNETGSNGFVYEKNFSREWDYRDYDMDCDNALLKGEIYVIECNFFKDDES